MRHRFNIDRVQRRSNTTDHFDSTAWNSLLDAVADFIAAQLEKRLRGSAQNVRVELERELRLLQGGER